MTSEIKKSDRMNNILVTNYNCLNVKIVTHNNKFANAKNTAAIFSLLQLLLIYLLILRVQQQFLACYC